MLHSVTLTDISNIRRKKTMAKAIIGPGKKRHTLTLTETVVVRFQNICRETGLPPATLSNAVDDFLKGIVDVLETARRSGRFTLSDMFNMMGKQMELLPMEEKQGAKSSQKAKGVVKRIKAGS
jgi:hypothetical protein